MFNIEQGVRRNDRWLLKVTRELLLKQVFSHVVGPQLGDAPLINSVLFHFSILAFPVVRSLSQGEDQVLRLRASQSIDVSN